MKSQKKTGTRFQATVRQSAKRGDKQISMWQLKVTQSSSVGLILPLPPLFVGLHLLIYLFLFFFWYYVSIVESLSSEDEGFTSPSGVHKWATNERKWKKNVVKEQCVTSFISSLGLIWGRDNNDHTTSVTIFLFSCKCYLLHVTAPQFFWKWLRDQ